MKLVGTPDLVILVAALLLVAFGLTMVLCASAALDGDGVRGPGLVTQQLERAAIGLLALAAAFLISPEQWRRLAPLAAGLAALLVIATLTPLGRSPGGQSAHRWLVVGRVTLQPSEVLKLALVLHLARLLARQGEHIRTWQGLLPALTIVVVLAGLVAVEPSMGMAVSIGLVGIGLIVVAGARARHLLLLLALLVAAGLQRIWFVPYERERLQHFLGGASRDLLGDGYQLYQSLIALGSGGWLGRGFGQSLQKFQFLPAPHTDFIFAIIGEEGGILVAVLVLGVYALIVARALRLAFLLEDPFHALVAAGIALMIAVQVFLNVAVVTGLAPTTGLPLPFLSYGGSSLVVHLAAVGVLLRISAGPLAEQRA